MTKIGQVSHKCGLKDGLKCIFIVSRRCKFDVRLSDIRLPFTDLEEFTT